MLDPSLIAPALEEIDPQSRALIELFHRRNLRESDIEDLLGIGPGELTARRMAAEIEFAGELGVGLGELQTGLPQLDDGDWTGAPPAHEAGPPTDELEPLLYHHVEPVHDHLGPSLDYMEPLPDDEVPDEESSGLGLWIAALCAGLATAVIVLVVVAANSDDGTDSKADAKTATTRPAAKTPAVGLQKLNGTTATGTAVLSGTDSQRLLDVKVQGLPDPQAGMYSLWLYNSPEDAVRLQTTKKTGFDVKMLLPDGYGNYRFIDVSGEDDTNPAHTGVSLLRVSFAKLEAK